jgi:membrane-bound serine protease (ClpP class)
MAFIVKYSGNRLFITGVLLALSILPGAGMLGSPPLPVHADDNRGDGIVFCPIEGDILDGVSVLVDRAVNRETQGAKAIVFIIDTFGGRVDSAIDIANTIMESPVPTIAYVTGRGAISAGALIAYACDDIVMAPGVNIGASTPISPGVEMTEEMNEKSMSFLRAKYRALGEEQGHNPLIGEAMVDASIELYGVQEYDGGYRVYKVERNKVVESRETKQAAVDSTVSLGEKVIGLYAQPGVSDTLRGFQETLRNFTKESELPVPPEQNHDNEEEKSPVQAMEENTAIQGLPANAKLICPAGKLLTLTTGEALEVGLIRISAESAEQALLMLDYEPFTAIPIEMTWAEVIFAFLTSPMISGLLLLCGIGGIYVEFKTPGLGLPGLIGVACFALFFGSRMVIGIADWLDVLLVLAGLALLALEIFVIPGFGLAGLSGIVCLVVGIYMSLIRVPVPEYTWDYMRLRDAGITLMLTSLVFSLFIILTWKVFPRTRLARGLIQAYAQNASDGYTVQTAADSQNALGLQGKATTMLRPAGRGRFGPTTYDVVTRGEFIPPGQKIEIIQVEGNRYVVRESEEETHS